jgi:hypothetical protein
MMWRPFRELGSAARRRPSPGDIRRPRGVKTTIRRSLDYQKIKEQVEEAILRLPLEKRWRIPAGTLPERMVALALCYLDVYFQAQRSEDGGRLRLGGAVVDFLVFIGSLPVVVRVQGDYWHSLPSRKLKDRVQWDRLHMRGYRVADIWEHELYQQWSEGRLPQLIRFVELKIRTAA